MRYDVIKPFAHKTEGMLAREDLVARVAERTGVTKRDIEMIIPQVFESISDMLLDKQKVFIPGFGTFIPYITPGKIGQVPATGEPLEIPPMYRVKFKANFKLKNALKALPIEEELEA